MSDFYRQKRVLVTGGAGVIGTELICKLVASDAKVLCCDLKPRPEALSSDVLYVQGDANYLADETIREFAPEVLVHLAATFERAIETEEFWGENFWHNVRLSHHLMTRLKAAPNLRRVVFASSYLIYDPAQYMFDKPQDAPCILSETSPIQPRNICGGAKLLHEIELRFLTEFASAPFSAVSARIYRVYGKRSGDVVSRWVRALIEQPDEPLTLYGDSAMFDYVYAGDVAEGLLRLGASAATGIVNLGSGRARRVSELVDILRSHFPTLVTKEVPSDVPYEAHQANLSQLKELLDWDPPTTLEEGVSILVEHERATPAALAQTEPAGNVLVTSASRKVPLIKGLQAAQRELGWGRAVWAGDSNPHCVASHFADDFWTMPKTNDLSADDLVAFCNQHDIKLVVPTRDGELPRFAQYRERLADEGIFLPIASPDTVETCLDKLAFYRRSTALDVPTIATASSLDELLAVQPNAERFVVKERFGAGAKTVGVNLSRDQAERHSANLDEAIFQPHVIGTEYSVDLYVGRHGHLLGVVPRARLEVVSGESVITETREHAALFAASIALAKAFNLRGHNVLQAFDTESKILFIECNPRVGGASTLSFAAGLPSPKWMLLEANGRDIDPQLGQYQRGLTMIRSSTDTFFPESSS